MESISNQLADKVALVTGGAQRIGAEICRCLHREGMDLVIHYRSSAAAAEELQEELQQQRPESVLLLQADLLHNDELHRLIEQTGSWRGRLDLLVNNASSFYPTAVGETTVEQWNDLLGSNLQAPFFLSQAAAPLLRAANGAIINMVDIHAERPLSGYPVYSMAKAANAMMVKALARELGPEIRVNGVAPGTILWPQEGLNEKQKEQIIARTALQRPGEPADIGRAVLFLARDSAYVTGQIINVDGGRTVQQ